ncbi:uncharacterized protein AB675_6758 [Cyphellophora attinorum]|uniref:Transmembrane protein n=1 Tax=Cyphellophora attinorum TaxID=1664694 RepID=A0A0N1HYJ3_9EURO|nr:uncharacterized protein AB675_6758 [Phialophora attinorum]KPI43532.1 hypothetical protein AB675_6758 [Phialophora attinorum]
MASNTVVAQDPLPKEVVILLAILGAAVATMLGYAVHRTLYAQQYRDRGDSNTPGDQQTGYMREVRERNLQDMDPGRRKERRMRGPVRGRGDGGFNDGDDWGREEY